MKNLLASKIRLGRVSVPVWTSVLALAVTGLAAGQAVGPVLTGSVTGSVGLTVEQAITMDTDRGVNGLNVSGADDSVSTVNDEGTEFTVAVELNVGQRILIDGFVRNDSGADGAVMLELNVPAGIDVELDELGDDMGEAQLTRSSWLLLVDDVAGTVDDDDGFRLTVEPKDDLKPGFYTITGRLVQISG